MWTLHFSASAYTTQSEKVGQMEGFYDPPFSGGPWLLVWGKVEGWVCISRFCRWSSFGFHQWMEAVRQNSSANIFKLNSPFNSHSAVTNSLSRFTDATVASIYVHLLPLLACHTWELPNSTSPLRGYVRSSLGSLEPWGRGGNGQHDKAGALHWIHLKICLLVVWPTCIR